ncbi:MAG: AI-2E family transporter [Campylobacter sp.]|nr:AI-2E family transporter [Campylobacter sp.]
MKKTRKYFFIGLILLVFCFVVYLFMPFWLPISVGILLAVSTSSLNRYFRRITSDKNILSATLTTFALIILFLAPFMYAIIKLAVHASSFDIGYINKTVDFIKNFDFHLPEAFASWEPRIKEFIASFDIASIFKQGVSYLSSIGKSSAKFIFDLALIVVFYFFANIYGKFLIDFIKSTTPVESEHIDSISNEVSNTMAVVLYSTIATAVLQGFLFGVMIMFFGYDGFFMGIVYAFASMLPIVGGALVYIPISIYEFSIGNRFEGFFILIYSVIMISTIADSFVKPLLIRFINSKLVSNPANINELIIFFAMIAGLSAFGFWGLILGPAIVTLFVACLNAYRLIISEEDKSLSSKKAEDINLINIKDDLIKDKI